MSTGNPHIQGVGLGLRFALLDELLALDRKSVPELRWLECHPENYMRRGGRFPEGLTKCRERWPFATHGLCMSLGGTDPLDAHYLAALDTFLRELEVPWHSDHLCFSVAHGAATHELLPLPRNEETVKHVSARIRQAQDALRTPLAIENVTQYVITDDSALDEGDFVSAIVRESGCALMLDVNNVFVNAENFGLDARATLGKMPLDRVVQMHVAGHWYAEPDLIIDTHAEPVRDEVFELLDWTLQRTGRVPVLLERDDDFPPLATLLDEVRRLDAIWQRAPSRRPSRREHAAE